MMIKFIQFILAFILPPVAVYMKVGISTHFYVSIILTFLGAAPWAVFGIVSGALIGFLLSVSHALYVLFSEQMSS